MDGAPPANSPVRKSLSKKRLSRSKSQKREEGFGSLVGDSDEGDALAKALTQKQISDYKSAPAPTPIGSGTDRNEDAAGQSRGVPRAVAAGNQQQDSQALRSNRTAVASAEPASTRGARGDVELMSALAQGEVTRALAEGFGTVNSKFDFLKECLFSQDQNARRILEAQEQGARSRSEAEDRQDQNSRRIAEALERQEEIVRKILEGQERVETAINGVLGLPNTPPSKGVELCGPYAVQTAFLPAALPKDSFDPRGSSVGAGPAMGAVSSIQIPTLSDDADALAVYPLMKEKPNLPKALEAPGDDDSDVDYDVPDVENVEDMQSVFVTPHYHITHTMKAHDHGNCLERLVESKGFEYASACVILSHSLFIGAYVEFLASVDPAGHPFFKIGNVILTGVFVLELVLKFGAERSHFVLGPEKMWNIFDICLILLVFLELALGIILAGKDKKKMKTVLKIAEMARTARILRIFRFLKFSSTLQIIIIKVFMSMKTLSWVLLLVLMMQGVVAVCFTQGANDYLNGKHHDPEIELTEPERAIHKHFGSVGRSVKTCFASISGGIMWEEVSEELGYISVLYALIFAFYIVASTFAVLNIITGIFMNDMARAEQDLEGDEQIRKMDVRHDELTELFHQLDEEGDGQITVDHFLRAVKEPVMVQIFDEIGITSSEASTLFQLLDEDQSGHLEVDEFLSGCLHLLQGSTGLDMKVLLYETRNQKRRLFGVLDKQSQKINEISREMKRFMKSSNRQANQWKAAGTFAAGGAAGLQKNMSIASPSAVAAPPKPKGAEASPASPPAGSAPPKNVEIASHDFEEYSRTTDAGGATIVAAASVRSLPDGGSRSIAGSRRRGSASLKVNARQLSQRNKHSLQKR